MTTLHTVSFQKTVLASLIGLCLSQTAFALQELPDENLSEATGEGIAFLPEGFSMRMNGVDDTNDTGYLRLIPVGPLQGYNSAGQSYTYSTGTGDREVYDATGNVIKKADVFLYGLDLSQSNAAWGAARGIANTNMSFGRPIDSWGTANNPWIFKTETKKVQQFSGNGAAGQDVTFFNFEAPLYNQLTSANSYNDINSLSSAEKSAYNLRLSLWGDAFMRDANIAEGKTTATAYNGLSNQLRFNMVWDGFSVNGSNFKMFRTLGGVTNQLGLSKAYNNTLGMAALVRLNSGPTDNIRANVVMGTPTNTWQSYDASSIKYVSDQLTEAQLATLKAGGTVTVNRNVTNIVVDNPSTGAAHTEIGTQAVTLDKDSIIIADGAGNAPSGTVVWNGKVALTGAGTAAGLATVNPANPNQAHVIRSYVPLGNKAGNNSITAPRAVVVDGKKTNIDYRAFWGYTETNGIGDFAGIKAEPYQMHAICGAPTTVSQSGSTLGTGTQCFNSEGFRIISALSSNTNTWTLPDAAKKSILRINAMPLADMNTPALGGTAPTFDDATKGLFLYGLNANLVIGSLYQPLIFDAKGGNFSIEVTRVPNDPNVYKNIYTRYDFDANTKELDGTTTLTYSGSTCNIYQCGASAIAGYQGSAATHSSITIGSTVYDPTKNQLSAYKGIEAYGISFGSLESNPQYGQTLTSTGQRDYVQTFNTTRDTSKNYTRSYMSRDDDGICGAFNWSTCYKWNTVSESGVNWNGQGDVLASLSGYSFSCSARNSTANGLCTPNPNNASTPAFYQYGPSLNCSNGTGGSTNNCSGNNYRIAYYNNPNYTASSWTNVWSKTPNTTRTQNENYQILGRQTGCLNNCGAAGIGSAIPTNFPTDLTSAKTLSNNMGSAVIDGLLIQHMKLTTTGLN